MGGRNLEKGTCTDYDIIMISEFKFMGCGGFRDCGAWDGNYLRAKQRVFLCYYPLNCYASRLNLAFSYLNHIYRDAANNLLLGGCKVKFT